MAGAQGNLSEIDKPGDFTKYLTPGTMDRWNFKAKKGDALFVEVRTTEFDAIVSVLRSEGDAKDVVLESIDDDGSNGRLMIRLPEDGAYSIGVQGFEQKGGGNYSLRMNQYATSELMIDQAVSGEFDQWGRANFYVVSTRDQCVTFESHGETSQEIAEFLDHTGREVDSWSEIYTLSGPGPKRENEYWLRLKGSPGEPFHIRLKSAWRAKLENELVFNLESGQAAVLDVNGIQGAFRVFEIVANKKLSSRLIVAPSRIPAEIVLGERKTLPAITMLKEFGKGRRKGSAVLLGTDKPYQLQLHSSDAAQVTVKVSDPREALSVGEASQQVLKVGEYRFFRFQPKSGQTTTIRVRSDDFDSLVDLYDDRGSTIAMNDDYRDEMNSQLRYTAYSDAPLTFFVGALGNGGGGKFTISVEVDEPKRIQSGDKKTQLLKDTDSEQWLYTAKEGEQIILYCQGRSIASLVVKNAKGVTIGEETFGEESEGIVKLVKFPKAGDYTIGVTVEPGEEYSLQVIPAG